MKSSLASVGLGLRSRLGSPSAGHLAAASLWQVANYAIPLLTFPYLARVLGVEGFGLIGLAGAIIGYAILVTDWGFGFSATREVARNRDEPEAIRQIVWSVLVARVALGLLATLLVVSGSLLASAALRPVLLAGLINLAAAVFSVEWALRGLERFAGFAAASIAGRLAAVPLVYLLVRDEADAAVAVVATGLGGVFATVLSGWALYAAGMLGRPVVDPTRAWAMFKAGTALFASTAAISFYTNTIAVVLGFVAGPVQLGLYAGAMRIKEPVQNALSPIAVVFFPRMSAVSASDVQVASCLARRLVLVQGGLALVLSIALVLAAPLLVRVLLGEAFSAVVPVLRVMALTVLMIGISNVTAAMILIPFGMTRELTLCVIAGALVGVLAVVPLTAHMGGLGAALTAVLAETAVAVLSLLLVARRLPSVGLWSERDRRTAARKAGTPMGEAR